jgi:hypothetical protein
LGWYYVKQQKGSLSDEDKHRCGVPRYDDVSDALVWDDWSVDNVSPPTSSNPKVTEEQIQTFQRDQQLDAHMNRVQLQLFLKLLRYMRPELTQQQARDELRSMLDSVVNEVN